MNNITLEIVTKQNVKNDFGRVIGEEYVTEKTFVSSYIFPMGDLSASRNYGIDIKTTHKILTREKLIANQTLKFGEKTFLIKYVAEFPTHNEVLLELVM